MKESAPYLKIVEWSQEDKCFVGQVPLLFRGGCHGDDEQSVYAELCEIADEVVALYQEDGDPLPHPTAGQGWPERIAKRLREVPEAGILPPEEGGRYVKLVEWSAEHRSFAGYVPGLIDETIYGNNEGEVYVILCLRTAEALKKLQENGGPLPPPTAGHNWASMLEAQAKAEDSPRT